MWGSATLILCHSPLESWSVADGSVSGGADCDCVEAEIERLQWRLLLTKNLGLFVSQVHLRNDCQFEELPCVRADCKERVLRKDLRDHVEKACKYREATCSHCKSQVPMITLQVSVLSTAACSGHVPSARTVAPE